MHKGLHPYFPAAVTCAHNEKSHIILEPFMIRLIAMAWLLCVSAGLHAGEGLIAVKSNMPPKQTMDKLEALVKQRGMTVFARVDHAEGATKIGKTLRPTEVLIFGNPQGGTPLMECAQSLAIDLPQKALVWQDDKGQVWLGYNDPIYLTRRHEAPQCPAGAAVAKGLAGLMEAAVAP
jgi:uncharacterized protein (DUF302 family)